METGYGRTHNAELAVPELTSGALDTARSVRFDRLLPAESENNAVQLKSGRLGHRLGFQIRPPHIWPGVAYTQSEDEKLLTDQDSSVSYSACVPIQTHTMPSGFSTPSAR